MEALMEDLVEEILLRLPPADPVSLLRAAAVCKRWGRIMSAPGFRRRFGECHRKPPMLGFLTNLRLRDALVDEPNNYATRFVSSTPFRPRRTEHHGRHALDSRHGLVLLASMPRCADLEVWDPVTDELWKLPKLPLPRLPSRNCWNAAVVRAAHGSCPCDHLVCHGGPFHVVLLDSEDVKMRTHVYSSEVGAWSEPTYGPPSPINGIYMDPNPSALVGNALCFLMDRAILMYDLDTRGMFLIPLPHNFYSNSTALTTMGDNRLAYAMVEESRLWMWSLETDPKGDAIWVNITSIEHMAVLQVDASSTRNDYVPHGIGIFFVPTQEASFSIDLLSGQVRQQEFVALGVVPYTSFYTPVINPAILEEVND